ncbi:MAG TPA: phage holin family protein [Opitutaceae bacterium]
MEPESTDSPGILGSLRILGDGFLATLEDRAGLVSVELQEEKLRLIQTFFWISAILFSAVMAITFASLTLVFIFWESARLAVLGGLALLYAVALVSIIVAFRRFLARQPEFLGATLQELRHDRACIPKRN